MCAERTRLLDIAQAAGVSVSTVSRALRRDSRISESTCRRVALEARRLGYTRAKKDFPGVGASIDGRNNTSQTPRRLGQLVVLALQPDPRTFFAETLVELFRLGQERGFSVDVVDGNVKNLSSHLTEAETSGADAVLLSTFAHLTETHSAMVASCRIPVVLLNRHVAGDTNAVTLDDLAAGMQAARYLVALGHNRIACFSGDLGSSSLRERSFGFRLGLDESNCYDPSLFYESPNDSDLRWVHSILQELLGLPAPPTAIWAYNDIVASALMLAIRSAGLDVPKDISVMGFDNRPEYRALGLTTFDYRLNDLAHAALALVEALLANTVRGPVRLSIAAPLVEGSTTGPARSRVG